MNMSVMIQIKNVPSDRHRRLKARAALAGASLSDFPPDEIRRADRIGLIDRRPIAMDFERVLSGGDRRSIGRANEVAAFVRDRPATLPALVRCLDSADPLVRMRAADALEKVSARDAGKLDGYADFFLGLARESSEQEVKWHMAQILPRLALTGRQIGRAVSLFARYRHDPSRIVKASALSALAALAAKNPGVMRKVGPILENALRSAIPSVRARARKLLGRTS
jgi:HEAT repeat protein